MSSRSFGILLVSVATIMWSSAGLFVRLLDLDAWTVLGWRSFFWRRNAFADHALPGPDASDDHVDGHAALSAFRSRRGDLHVRLYRRAEADDPHSASCSSWRVGSRL
jgi:hypothetical protein